MEKYVLFGSGVEFCVLFATIAGEEFANTWTQLKSPV